MLTYLCLSPGYAGIDNDLFKFNVFADAKMTEESKNYKLTKIFCDIADIDY